jgi:mono/diheme cytochrome c family protein
MFRKSNNKSGVHFKPGNLPNDFPLTGKLKTTVTLIRIILFLIFICGFVSEITARPDNSIKKAIPAIAVKDTLPAPANVTRTPQELFQTCAKCHSIGKGKLIGPDLSGVKNRHDSAWFIKFIHSSDSLIMAGDTSANWLFLSNGKLPMPHNNYSPKEIKALVDYIDIEGRKLKANPKFLDNSFSYRPPSNSWLFILCLLLILLPVIDLAFTRFIKFKILNFLLIFAGMGLFGKILYEETGYMGRSLGYEPDQPIKFSHKVHAGENKINCIYCHPGVNESKYASIPSTNLCLNCHNVVRYGTNTGEVEIDKIHKAVEEGKPIAWVRVYALPDFVFFSHVQHVKVGKIDCKECHGDVAKMGRIQQFADLSMGWCMNCHKKTAVQFNNKYYTSYKQHKDLISGKIKKVTVEDIGGNDCMKCHY